MIQTVSNRFSAEAFRSAHFYSTVEESVHKCPAEPQNVDRVAIWIFDASVFTLTVAKCFMHEFDKTSFHKVKIEELFDKFAEVVREKHIKVEEGVQI